VNDERGGTCPHQDRLPALVNGHLPAEEARMLGAHLDACPACRAEETRLRELVATLRALPSLAAPLGLREQILERAAEQSATLRRPPEETKVPPRAQHLPADSRLPTTGHRLPTTISRLAAALTLLLIAWIGVAYFGGRYRGRTAGEWLLAARQTAERCYSLHVVGWVKTPRGIVPVEGWRLAGALTVRVGRRPRELRGGADGPRLLLATWGGAAGRFDFGEPLLFEGGPERPPAGRPRFHSRVPLVIALPRAGALVQRVWIDPVSEQVLRAQLVGPDGRPTAALERLEYNQFPPVPSGG
jgi:putative zinc finger protein